jgi:hypothetical protein
VIGRSKTDLTGEGGDRIFVAVVDAAVLEWLESSLGRFRRAGRGLRKKSMERPAQPAVTGVVVVAVMPILGDVIARNGDRQIQNRDRDELRAGERQPVGNDHQQVSLCNGRGHPSYVREPYRDLPLNTGIEQGLLDARYLSWAAANRDPTLFADPLEFRLDRRSNPHLSFGAGIHACPGTALARMELRVLLEELLRRLPDLRVETRNPAYQFGGGDYVFIPSLNVSFTPARPDMRD